MAFLFPLSIHYGFGLMSMIIVSPSSAIVCLSFLPVLYILFSHSPAALTSVEYYSRRSMKHLVQSCAPRSGRSRMGNNARTSYSRYDESSFDSFFFPGGVRVLCIPFFFS
ncbi:Uncharacterized protein APZ42_027224 [Daphnia magna]|uniref:Uncharacterized protein n=1 Tax=Daphnia magna TaxID=35525 RepID=A0A164RDD1_9CRUS|nr:Uncharacterized protein APZ42_027224 [Daphnia magna]